jgi:hypothetical protein
MEVLIFVVGLLIILVVSVLMYYRFGPVPEDKPVEDASGSAVKPAPAPAPKPEPEPEPQDDASGCKVDASGVPLKSRDLSFTFLQEDVDAPFAQTPINKVDDYEYSLVFKNEGDRGMTKQTRDYLMSQHPRDWSVQPPSSDLFQQGLQAYKEGYENASASASASAKAEARYKNIDGSSMTPPDLQTIEAKEREILQTYTPKDPQSLTTYDAEDAKVLIERIYNAKGLVPTYTQTGDNTFQITSTRSINTPEIIYEDDQPAPASTGPVRVAGEDTIVVPEMAKDYDTFFSETERTRDGRWDYTKFTPGLERMFAPTEPREKWY